MTVMIVDDDPYVVENIRRRIDWDALGVDRILTAETVRQAKAFWDGVDVLLTDVEMPQGSGLELLAWAREQHYDVQAIVLTAYADFTYAHKALELNSLMYFLKPVDYAQLFDGLRRAVDKADEEHRRSRQQAESGYWQHNLRRLKDLYWSELLTGHIAADKAQQTAAERHLGYAVEERFVPVSFVCDGAERADGGRLLAEEMRALAEPCYQTDDFLSDAMATLPDERIVFILRMRTSVHSLTDVSFFSQRLLKECRAKLGHDFACGVGDFCTCGDAAENVRRLGAMQSELAESAVVRLRCEYSRRDIPYNTPAIGVWESFLTERRQKALMDNINLYLDGLVQRRELSGSTLRLFRLDLQQLVYSFLRGQEIQAHQLFADAQSDRIYDLAVRSVEDMKRYAAHLVGRALEYTDSLEESDSIVQKLLDYLDRNYARTVSRTDLAESVYLNPDYVSRIFRKATGRTVNAYLTDKRIEKAKELLAGTSLPVNAVAMHVGYSNFAYFTKLFRETTGVTPNEYRKQHAREDGAS